MVVNTHQPIAADDDDLIPAAVVKRENGGISDMTLWRWIHSPRVQFPRPDVIINDRRYWKRRTLRQHRQRIENLPKEMTKAAQLPR
jgi:hypothetical protein